jgi:hypothetical protein
VAATVAAVTYMTDQRPRNRHSTRGGPRERLAALAGQHYLHGDAANLGTAGGSRVQTDDGVLAHLGAQGHPHRNIKRLAELGL